VAGAHVGLQPRSGESVIDGTLTENVSNQWSSNPLPQSFENPTGNPVLHGTNTYAVYWDPFNRYDGDWQHVVDVFLQSVGAASGSQGTVFAVDAQYTDTSNKPATYQSTYRGAYTDTHHYPGAGCVDPKPLKQNAVTCLSDSQLQEELKGFIAQNNLPKGMNSIFYILTPPGVTVCLDGPATHCSDFTRTALEESEEKFQSASYHNSFCSYHSAINPDNVERGDGNTILYAAIPWSAGLVGDGNFAKTDRTQAYQCQDGGFNASSKPPEQREEIKPRNAQEQKELNEKTPEEKEKIEKQAALQGPHIEEPNQVTCPSPDGYCDTGLADLITNQVAVEQQNMVTDPMLNAWQDSAHNEATDECRNYFATAKMGGGALANPETEAASLSNQTLNGHNYYLNSAFNFAGLRLSYPGVPCIPGVSLEPQFTAPNTVNAGDIVDFDGMESNISLNAAVSYSAGGSPQVNYATYTWAFGDGSAAVSGYAPGDPTCEAPWISPCAASVFHSYKYGGTYTVRLTVTDVGGYTATVTKTVTVVGPPPPHEEGSSGTTSSSTSSAGSSGSHSVASGPGGASSKPKPVAVLAALSRSLRRARRSGLVLRYSINEEVVGHFEVLLASPTAHRLGVKGTPAKGLPTGTPAQVIIGRAILVATKAGRSTVDIVFSKDTAARLGRLRNVSLMLRLVVHNAADQSVTTVATVTLSH
jgi:hypothetical protein